MMYQALQQSQDIHADTILVWITETVIVGLVASHAALWLSHTKHKQHVAEQYISKPDNAEVKQAIVDIQKSLRDILAIVHELKGRSEGARHE